MPPSVSLNTGLACNDEIFPETPVNVTGADKANGNRNVSKPRLYVPCAGVERSIVCSAGTEHDAFVYEPLNVPFVHVRVCDMHCVADDDWYAVTLAPFWTVWPLKVQEAAALTVHAAFVYEPDSAPLVHVRCCDTHWPPYGALDDWYAVTDAPCATVWLLKEHDWLWVMVEQVCIAAGLVWVQKESATVALVEEIQETVRDCWLLAQVDQPPACQE